MPPPRTRRARERRKHAETRIGPKSDPDLGGSAARNFHRWRNLAITPHLVAAGFATALALVIFAPAVRSGAIYDDKHVLAQPRRLCRRRGRTRGRAAPPAPRMVGRAAQRRPRRSSGGRSPCCCCCARRRGSRAAATRPRSGAALARAADGCGLCVDDGPPRASRTARAVRAGARARAAAAAAAAAARARARATRADADARAARCVRGVHAAGLALHALCAGLVRGRRGLLGAGASTRRVRRRSSSRRTRAARASRPRAGREGRRARARGLGDEAEAPPPLFAASTARPTCSARARAARERFACSRRRTRLERARPRRARRPRRPRRPAGRFRRPPPRASAPEDGAQRARRRRSRAHASPGGARAARARAAAAARARARRRARRARARAANRVDEGRRRPGAGGGRSAAATPRGARSLLAARRGRALGVVLAAASVLSKETGAVACCCRRRSRRSPLFRESARRALVPMLRTYSTLVRFSPRIPPPTPPRARLCACTL